MMASEFIVDVSEADFEYQVLAYSQKVPVLVDFWAEWCAPCRVLGPLLEKNAIESQGAYRLAKVNVDANPNLATRYQVRSIPVVKAFRDGRMVAEFTGAQPEPKVREFIRSIAPNPNELALAKGLGLLEMGQPIEAEAALREVLKLSPGEPNALLGVSRSLLMQGRAEETLKILNNFPPSREYNSAEALRPLAKAMVDLTQYPQEIETDLDAAYLNALRLVERGNLEAAMDGLLEILRQDRNFRRGQARIIMLAIFELLGENDLRTRQYRSEFASVIF